MNIIHLLATSAIVALTATNVSMAQQERPSHQERTAPAEKIAPPAARQPPAAHRQSGEARSEPTRRTERLNGRLGETPRGRAETTGQASPSSERNPERDRSGAEQRLKSRQEERNGGTGRAQREDRLNRRPDENRANNQVQRENRTDRSSERNRFERDRERTGRADENRMTTGRGSAGSRANIDLTPEKRTRIHEAIMHERSAPRLRSVDFDVSVGARVPHAMRFLALPRTIVEIEPEWQGFDYFMIGDQIIVVNPRSMEIVAIVDV